LIHETPISSPSLDKSEELLRELFPELDALNTVTVEDEYEVIVHLASRLISLLEKTSNSEDLISLWEEECELFEEYHGLNLAAVLAASKPLEVAYRGVDIFFRNLASGKPDNIVFFNASIDQLTDLDEFRFIHFAENAIEQHFDRLDLRESFAYLVIPGYLQHQKAIAKWAKVAHKNKCILITDFENFEQSNDVKDFIITAPQKGEDIYLSSVVMTCNYLLVRRREELLGEEENIYIPASCALAARLYDFPVSAILSSRSYGLMKGIHGVAFDVKLSDLIALESHGLVTMMNKSGKVIPFSVRTLYDGPSIGLQLFSTVKLFDHISKVLIDLIYRTTFEVWTSRTQQDMLYRIMEIFNSLQGHEKIVTTFRLQKFERIEEPEESLILEISFQLLLGRTYLFSFRAAMGSGSYDWASNYSLE
jgi:hypothetical protein